MFIDPNSFKNFIHQAENGKPPSEAKTTHGHRWQQLKSLLWTVLGQRINAVFQVIQKRIAKGSYLDQRIKNLQDKTFVKESHTFADWSLYKKDAKNAGKLSQDLLKRLEKKDNYFQLKQQLRQINQHAVLILKSDKQLDAVFKELNTRPKGFLAKDKMAALLDQITDDPQGRQIIGKLLSNPMLSATLDEVLNEEGRGGLRRQVLEVRYERAAPLLKPFESLLSITVKEPFEDVRQKLESEQLKLSPEQYTQLKKDLEDGVKTLKETLKRQTGENIDSLVKNGFLSEEEGDEEFDHFMKLLSADSINTDALSRKVFDILEKPLFQQTLKILNPWNLTEKEKDTLRTLFSDPEKKEVAMPFWDFMKQLPEDVHKYASLLQEEPVQEEPVRELETKWLQPKLFLASIIDDESFTTLCDKISTSFSGNTQSVQDAFVLEALESKEDIEKKLGNLFTGPVRRYLGAVKNLQEKSRSLSPEEQTLVKSGYITEGDYWKKADWKNAYENQLFQKGTLHLSLAIPRKKVLETQLELDLSDLPEITTLEQSVQTFGYINSVLYSGQSKDEKLEALTFLSSNSKQKLKEKALSLEADVSKAVRKIRISLRIEPIPFKDVQEITRELYPA